MNVFPSLLFLAIAQAVQILSMMETDISIREAEVKTLRREAGALNFRAAAQEEEHKTEVRNLSTQLDEARSAVVSKFYNNNNIQFKDQLHRISRQLSTLCVCNPTQGKLNEQLRIVLGENVALQKQLIKLERHYLKSMMKSSPITQIKGE